MTEDVFPIEHSDFPASHSLVFRGVYIYIYFIDPPILPSVYLRFLGQKISPKGGDMVKSTNLLCPPQIKGTQP